MTPETELRRFLTEESTADLAMGPVAGVALPLTDGLVDHTGIKTFAIIGVAIEAALPDSFFRLRRNARCQGHDAGENQQKQDAATQGRFNYGHRVSPRVVVWLSPMSSR